jgi:hypothetical protein
MSLIKLSNGVEISEETVVIALEKAGIETKSKHIFEAGDVAYIDGINIPSDWRLIISVEGRLRSVNQNGYVQGNGTQQYFENNHYQYYDRQEDLLKLS